MTRSIVVLDVAQVNPDRKTMVRKRGLEPLHLSIPDFKSSASTDFATPACNSLVRVRRFELHTSHYRGGYSTRLSYTLNFRPSAKLLPTVRRERSRGPAIPTDSHADANSGSRPRDLRSAYDRRSPTELCPQWQNAGFEPTTSAFPRRHATRLRYTLYFKTWCG